MNRHVPLTLWLLLWASAALAQAPEKTYAAFPTGEGDPDAITCRPPQPIPDTRLRGPEVCKKNSTWAQYRRDGMDVAPDGIHDMRLRDGSGINCSVTPTTGGANWTGRMNMSCLQPPKDGHYVPPAGKRGIVCPAEQICG